MTSYVQEIDDVQISTEEDIKRIERQKEALDDVTNEDLLDALRDYSESLIDELEGLINAVEDRRKELHESQERSEIKRGDVLRMWAGPDVITVGSPYVLNTNRTLVSMKNGDEWDDVEEGMTIDEFVESDSLVHDAELIKRDEVEIEVRRND